MTDSLSTSLDSFYGRIKEILENARRKVYLSANHEMLNAYWNIGKEIVEEELKGEDRANYGSQLIDNLSLRLTKAFGKGFNKSNLHYMKQFYQKFENFHALRGELSWTHYRLLLKVDNEDARLFYIKQTIDGNWSTRQLERQINSLYYERILMSVQQRRNTLKIETRWEKDSEQISYTIKDPFVLEFLDLKQDSKLVETQLESALL